MKCEISYLLLKGLIWTHQNNTLDRLNADMQTVDRLDATVDQLDIEEHRYGRKKFISVGKDKLYNIYDAVHS